MADPLLDRELARDYAHLEARADELLNRPASRPVARAEPWTAAQVADRVFGALMTLCSALGLMIWWIIAGAS